MRTIYTLVECNAEDDTETLLKSFANEAAAMAEMKKLDADAGPRVLHFIVETELVEEDTDQWLVARVRPTRGDLI
jgi:hypothetical protein